MENLFVIGVGRSGTTLIQSILNAHSKVAFTPETHFIYNYLGLKKTHTPKTSEELLEILKQDSNIKRLNLDLSDVVRQISFDTPKSIWIDTFKTIQEMFAKIHGVNIIGDKDPMNSGFLKIIKIYFPKAYIIHIIRDPRDVLLSRLKSDWGKKYPLLAHLGDHKISLEKALKEGPELFGERYLEIKYEDLIRDPENSIKQLCTALPIEFEMGMLDFSQSSKSLVSEEESKWKGNIFGEIMKGNSAKWKKGLSQMQINLTHLFFFKIIKKFKYYQISPVPLYLHTLKIPFFFIQLYFSRKYQTDFEKK